MSTSTQPREYTGATGGVQALLYHASQVGEIARFLNGRGCGAQGRDAVDATDSTVHQLIEQVRRRSVTSRISLGAAVPDTPADPLGSLQASLLKGQGETRLLVSRSLLADGTEPWQLSAYAGDAAVRVAGHVIPRMTLIDGTVAVLGDSSGRLTVVRDKVVVRTLRSLFDTAWDGAVDPGVFTGADGGPLWDTEPGSPLAQILPLLGSGWTDTAAARELGWSVRTYRRHVADLMQRLRARSRFEAGMRTAQLRLGSGPE
ncbi:MULTISPECIES: helix-turn-helix transcriptional regulator [unclassified Streptomyces]|uniref:helix-turn-helix transcriptional regulator n=1 Tax=unclassified Streptomyces TaxID=2593676 RepID=UPI002E2A6E5C|nr:hypothetical protein [Streptomyces sp. NBC_00223]